MASCDKIPDREILSACLDLLLQIASAVEKHQKSITLYTEAGTPILVVSSRHCGSDNVLSLQGHSKEAVEKTFLLPESSPKETIEPV